MKNINKIRCVYANRSFYCESCAHVFTRTKEVVPYTAMSTECPECGFGVSTSNKAGI